MPTYLYQCDKKHTADITHSIQEDPAVTCQLCGGAMSRKPAGITVTFNGTGFYRTDRGDA